MEGPTDRPTDGPTKQGIESGSMRLIKDALLNGKFSSTLWGAPNNQFSENWTYAQTGSGASLGTSISAIWRHFKEQTPSDLDSAQKNSTSTTQYGDFLGGN